MGLRNTIFGLAAGVILLLIGSASDEAQAQCCAPPPPPCCTPPSPPPCCTPPTPPPRPPSPPGCCDSGGGRVNVTVNANVTAVAVSGAGSRAGAVVYGGGGGGGGGYVGPGATGVIQGLNVEGALKKKQVAYEAKRSRTRRVVIRAYCVDDRDTPHPASQVFAGEEVADGYEGELYRCIAGTRMQWTVIEWEMRASNQGGKSYFCGKNESLYYENGGAASGDGLAGGPNTGGSVEGGARAGRVACRPQRPARDCNERSLLRRFGAGIKVITITEVETYTAYREETVREESSASFSMSLDGGVGGTVY
ncbi:hypothetical protein [Caulobacter sp. NIBR1757]|uniref:hypothetical protein n=1 Tax=Caulobacter sp. NIBR1757 TaxID=3016000 RepID=UPI0022F03FDE|nr:hypothetical protein [Caulobacter sp. NIBR1757]WGM39829.1 hypothetical protein AMEJIAPC_02769 [Caulobacter sp. NIBR1757]